MDYLRLISAYTEKPNNSQDLVLGLQNHFDYYIKQPSMKPIPSNL